MTNLLAEMSAPTSWGRRGEGMEIGAALSWGRERPPSYFSDGDFTKLRFRVSELSFRDCVTPLWT